MRSATSNVSQQHRFREKLVTTRNASAEVFSDALLWLYTYAERYVKRFTGTVTPRREKFVTTRNVSAEVFSGALHLQWLYTYAERFVERFTTVIPCSEKLSQYAQRIATQRLRSPRMA